MQVETSRVSAAAKPLSPELAAWELFRRQVLTVDGLDVVPENLPSYYKLVSAFRAFRGLHIKPRTGQKGRVRGQKDPTLERWHKQTSRFADRFWGEDLGHWQGSGDDRVWISDRSARKGVAPEILSVMLAWSRIRDAWHRHTPAGKEARRKADKRYNATEKGKAAKAAYRASYAGKTSQAKATKKRARKRRIAAAEQEQAMFDAWQAEMAIEEALAGV